MALLSPVFILTSLGCLGSGRLFNAISLVNIMASIAGGPGGFSLDFFLNLFDSKVLVQWLFCSVVRMSDISEGELSNLARSLNLLQN